VTVITYEPGERAHEKFALALERDGIGCNSWAELTGPDRAAWAAVEDMLGNARIARSDVTSWCQQAGVEFDIYADPEDT
jgi:hypothetical protein